MWHGSGHSAFYTMRAAVIRWFGFCSLVLMLVSQPDTTWSFPCKLFAFEACFFKLDRNPPPPTFFFAIFFEAGAPGGGGGCSGGGWLESGSEVLDLAMACTFCLISCVCARFSAIMLCGASARTDGSVCRSAAKQVSRSVGYGL
eukprot:SAG11_NODE_182_length_13233_cov_59.525238_14_plen_144_part_00